MKIVIFFPQATSNQEHIYTHIVLVLCPLRPLTVTAIEIDNKRIQLKFKQKVGLVTMVMKQCQRVFPYKPLIASTFLIFTSVDTSLFPSSFLMVRFTMAV